MTEETIFAAALDKQTPAERSAFLDAACAGDTGLRQRVAALLAAHEQAEDFLEQPVLHQIAVGLSPAHGPTEAIKPDVEGIAGKPADVLLGPAQAAPSPEGDEPSLDFLAPSQRADALGRIDHYHVLAIIGRGGMGVVLKAFDDELQRVVAIKVMASRLAATGNARKRFRREAQAAAAVRNEHIIDIHAVDDVNGLPYLVMEYVSGISLQDRLDRSGPLELKEILRIGMQTAAGLAKAHAQGLIHRDIKPANILLENGVQRVKITDFGLARAVDDASLTQSGVIAGTPQYMAPEQATGAAVDHRADLFSLGSVLYAMCTGRPPFRANSVMATLKRVCEDAPRPVREVNPEIPDWLEAILDKLHAKEPDQRFQSAEEVADLLGQHLAHLQQPGTMMPPLPVERPMLLHPRKHSPALPRALARAGSGKAIASLILGILSCFCSILTGLPAVLLGIFALRDIDRRQGRLSGKGLAIAGIVTACVGTFLSCLLLLPFVGLLLPAFQKASDAAARTRSANNLREMSRALHDYHDANGHLPAAAICDKTAKPLLSWRVAILPFIDQQNLYQQFRLDEPWDSPNNIRLLPQMPKVYQLPGDTRTPSDRTHYQVFVGKGATFEKTRGLRIPQDFPDGPAVTILIVEAAQAVPWTKPDDLPFAPNQPLPPLGGHFAQGYYAVSVDGSVHFIPQITPQQTLRSLITRNDGMPVAFP